MIIWSPASKTTIEARNTRAGVGHFSYANGSSQVASADVDAVRAAGVPDEGIVDALHVNFDL